MIAFVINRAHWLLISISMSGPAGQLLLAADLGDGRAELVVGLDAVLRAMHVPLQLRVAQVAQRVGAADQLVELEDRPPRRV
jgi:hypothetical protein